MEPKEMPKMVKDHCGEFSESERGLPALATRWEDQVFSTGRTIQGRGLPERLYSFIPRFMP